MREISNRWISFALRFCRTRSVYGRVLMLHVINVVFVFSLVPVCLLSHNVVRFYSLTLETLASSGVDV